MRLSNRIISALLLITLMLSFVSCANNEETAAASTTAENQQIETEPQETTTARIEANLPEKDFDGYNFTVLTKGATNVHWKSKDIYAAELNGEVINDAVFERNSKVCEKYNFNVVERITSVDTWNLYNDVQKAVLAGSDEIDMAAIGLTGDFRNLATKGMLLDLNTVEYMDLTQPWYDQNANSQISIAGKLYATVGDLIIMDNEATLGVLFSKKLAEDYNLGDFYDDVDNGTWTLDRCHDCLVETSIDLDGDGVHNEFDQWGIISEGLNTYAMIVGSNQQAVIKNADDLPEIVIENDKFYTAFEKSLSINGDFDLCMHANNITGYTDIWAECIDKAFSEDRVLFNCAGLVRVRSSDQ